MLILQDNAAEIKDDAKLEHFDFALKHRRDMGKSRCRHSANLYGSAMSLYDSFLNGCPIHVFSVWLPARWLHSALMVVDVGGLVYEEEGDDNADEEVEGDDAAENDDQQLDNDPVYADEADDAEQKLDQPQVCFQFSQAAVLCLCRCCWS